MKWLAIVILPLASTLIALDFYVNINAQTAINRDDASLLNYWLTWPSAAKKTLLASALEQGKKNCFSSLVSKCSDFGNIACGRTTLLLAAAQHPDPFWLRVLLEHGANPNQREGQKKIAIASAAISADRIENLKLLLHFGADPDSSVSNTSTIRIIEQALQSKFCDSVILLMHAGAKINYPARYDGSFFQRLESMSIELRDSNDVFALSSWYWKNKIYAYKWKLVDQDLGIYQIPNDLALPEKF